MLIKDNYAAAEFKDIAIFKFKWLINIIYKFYMNYVELYNFDDLI